MAVLFQISSSLMYSCIVMKLSLSLSLFLSYGSPQFLLFYCLCATCSSVHLLKPIDKVIIYFPLFLLPSINPVIVTSPNFLSSLRVPKILSLINTEQQPFSMFYLPENLVATCFRFINIRQLKHISISSKLFYLRLNYITIYMPSVNSLISFY